MVVEKSENITVFKNQHDAFPTSDSIYTIDEILDGYWLIHQINTGSPNLPTMLVIKKDNNVFKGDSIPVIGAAIKMDYKSITATKYLEDVTKIEKRD